MSRRIPAKRYHLFDFRLSLVPMRRPKAKQRRARLYLYTRRQRRQALDPETPPERLRGLLKLRSLGAALAANPNVPPWLLLSLGERFPAEFLANPSLPLLLLEDPNFIRGLPEKAMMVLLANDACTVEFMAMSLSHPSYLVGAYLGNSERTPAEILLEMYRREVALYAVAKNSRTPVEVLLALAEGDNAPLRAEVARNPSLPRSRLRLLQHASGSLSLDAPSEKIVGVAREDLLLLSEGGVYARRLAARHPEAPIAALLRLAKDEQESVRQTAAGNPSLPMEALDVLAGESSYYVKMVVARNPNLSEESMRVLSRDEQPEIRAGIAGHPRVPIYILGGLARDLELPVALAILKNKRTTPQIIASMAGVEDERVQMAICENLKTPREVLEILLKAQDTGVRRAAKKRLTRS